MQPRFEHLPFNLYEHNELDSTTVDGKRQYVTPDGTFPSITTVLGRKKAQAIKKWRERVGAEEANKITTQASRRGTNMHKVVENYLDNDGNIKIPEVLRPYMKSEKVIKKAGD